MMSLIGSRPWKWNGRLSTGERSRQKASPEGERGDLNTGKTRLNTGKEQARSGYRCYQFVTTVDSRTNWQGVVGRAGLRSPPADCLQIRPR